MPKIVDKETIYTFRVIPYQHSTNGFSDWQMRFNKAVAAFPGFISIEITLSKENINEWNIRERFTSIETLRGWQQSSECKSLECELKEYADEKNIQKIETKINEDSTGTTEVIVTQVAPGKEGEFRQWMATIHQAESQFPGFRGAYVQSPCSSENHNWITLLQFDTAEHLNDWLLSPERATIIKESESLITSFEKHRVVSPFAGWFSAISKDGEPTSAWKQAMIVLLVLYPIVMLEIMFLNPHLEKMHLAPKMFIGNVVSIAFVTWVMMPITISLLSWWLVPIKNKKLITWVGSAMIISLYFLEVFFFHLFKFHP